MTPDTVKGKSFQRKKIGKKKEKKDVLFVLKYPS